MCKYNEAAAVQILFLCLMAAGAAGGGGGYVEEDNMAVVELLHRSLRFEPTQLDFGTLSVGTAHSHTVTIVNQNKNRSVYLSSVSGRAPAFFSSFFEAKVVPPQGNTTFNVVFLPRTHGAVATDLLIHTSFGQARLLVRGEGRDCPYRLKPIVGIKAPLNATLTPEIHMYNPHERPLQILEIYSSGGQFQLELPSGGQEGPQTLWEIPPHSTKPIIRIRFQGQIAGNYTAYIRIKISEQSKQAAIDSGGGENNVLVVPVEFEILSQHGIYAENPLIDFGRLTTENVKQPVKIKLHLRNSNINENSADVSDELMRYDLASKINGISFHAHDGSVMLDPQEFKATTTIDELLKLRSASKRNTNNETSEFMLLVRAQVFKGSIFYNRNTTLFVTQTDNYVPGEWRSLIIRNDFELPLSLLNVSVDENNTDIMHMTLSNMYVKDKASAALGVVVLAPGKSMELLRLRVLQNNSLNFHSHLRIYTNVTQLNVPITICSGRLHVSTQDSSRLVFNGSAYSVELNLGAIPLAEMSQNGFIVLQNRNPLPIKLSTWDFQSPQGVYFHTTFLGCLRNGAARKTQRIRMENYKFDLCSTLEEGDVAIFQVAIQSYITDQNASGTLKIWTAYELITITVKFKTWVGKLEVDQEQLYFKKCFPGKLCSSDLSIRSTFKNPIHITSINFTDAGLRFEDFNVKGSIIAAETTTKVGRIYFEPALLCQDHCYIPQDDKTSSIAFPAPQDTKGGLNNNLRFDETELRRRTELFRQLKWHYQTITFTLLSREVRQFQLQLIVDIEWPKLVAGKQVLPTIEMGKRQQVPVVILNPADRPILVDYFLADPEYAKETQLSLPLEVVDISRQNACYLTDKSVFSLPNGSPKRQRQPVLIPARSSISVLVQFEANEADNFCTLLHIRNNLTLYEAVWLSAKTVHSQFRLGNRKPGSKTPLHFELNDKHLMACMQTEETTGSVSVDTYPLIQMKRTFTARNTGEIPIWIENFLIGDRPCEGYGFKVSDCSSFELKANASKKIEIAFSPDFTVRRIKRTLTLKTNLSYEVSFLLLGQLPRLGLERCLALVPRPHWEERIKNIALILLVITFVFMLVAAHIDYGNILTHQSVIYMSREKGTVHPTFNLRNIAIKTQQQQQSPVDQTITSTSAQSQQQRQHRNAGISCQSSKTVAATPTIVGTCAAGNHIKRRGGGGGGVRKSNCDNNPAGGGGGTSVGRLSERSWSTESSPPSANKGQTFSERSFKLRLEAEKAAAAAAAVVFDTSATTVGGGSSIERLNSNSNSPTMISNDCNAIIPKEVVTSPVDRDYLATNSTAGNGGGGKKQTQNQSRSVKKTKLTLSPTSNEKSTDKSKMADKSLSKSSSPTTEKKPPNEDETIGTQLAASCKLSPEVVKDAPEVAATNTKETNRKHGKTPGRERKKEQQQQNQANNTNSSTNNNNNMTFDINNSTSSSASSNSSCSSSKRTERKQKKGKPSTVSRVLNFGPSSTSPTSFDSTNLSNAIGSINCISPSPWEGTFSEVLQLQKQQQQQNYPVSRSSNVNEFNSAGDAAASLGFCDAHHLQMQSEHSLLDLDLNRYTNKETSSSSSQSHENAAKQATMMMREKNNVVDFLGPIGSKKSPSSTPVWGEPLIGTPTTTNPTTVANLQAPKPTNISNNTSFFSNLLPTYGATAAATAAAATYDEGQQHYMAALQQNCLYEVKKAQEEARQRQQRQWQTNEYNLHDMDSANNWTLTATPHNATWSPMGYGPNVVTSNVLMRRPPPGLEINYQSNINQAQQQQQQQYMQQLQALAQAKQNINVPVSNIGGGPPAVQNAADIQTFDPFSSLSSIWSDNWNKEANNSRNNNNNNHNNN